MADQRVYPGIDKELQGAINLLDDLPGQITRIHAAAAEKAHTLGWAPGTEDDN